MVIGETLSGLVDKQNSKMDFKTDDMSTPEALWYKNLVHVEDGAGDIASNLLEALLKQDQGGQHREMQHLAKRPAKPSESKVMLVQEVSDDSATESDNDLQTYAKPDSDQSDSDEDPTLLNRNKPAAPVYVRTLIAYLRNTESYDHQKLALSTAAGLIRRKASFGTEVASHAVELASLLVGLQDPFDVPNFQDMRLQAMIAVLVALPEKLGPWYSKTFFDGDYSISQRAAILTVLGVGARELAGFGADDARLTSMPIVDTSFPSKALPGHMHAIYAPSSAINSLTTSLTSAFLAPIAAESADKLTGPAILKTRTFSSRLASQQDKGERTKRLPNALASLVASCFFHPLTGRFHVHSAIRGDSATRNIAYSPHLLSLFIKTLGIMLHAAGPGAVTLQQMTGEYWDLLLALRSQGDKDNLVKEALLSGFLTVLECNTQGSDQGRNMVHAQSRELLETGEWVGNVLATLGAGAARVVQLGTPKASSGHSVDEEDRMRVLAAGIMIRIGEVSEKYRALLMGDLANFE